MKSPKQNRWTGLVILRNVDKEIEDYRNYCYLELSYWWFDSCCCCCRCLWCFRFQIVMRKRVKIRANLMIYSSLSLLLNWILYDQHSAKWLQSIINCRCLLHFQRTTSILSRLRFLSICTNQNKIDWADRWSLMCAQTAHF